MPIDPNLSLQVGPQGTQAQYNPLGMMKDVMDIQGKAQGLEQGRRELAAKAAAGQIFATSTDPQDAYQKLQQNPLTAAYAQDLATGALNMRNQILSGQQTQTQTQGLQQGQYKDAFGTVMQASLAALNTDDPAGNFEKFTKAAMGNLPPHIQKQIAPAIKSYGATIFGQGMSKEQSANMLMGAFLGVGGSPGQLAPYLPSYGQTREFGAQKQYGTQQGPLAGGEFQPTTAPTIGAVSPSVQAAPGGGALAVPGIPAQEAGGGGALAGGPTGLQGSPVTVSGGGGGNALMGGGGGGAATPQPAMNAAPVPQPDAFAGTRATAQQAGTAAKMREDFNSPQAMEEYNATNTSLMQLKQLDQKLNALSQAGGFTQPGSFGNLRGEFSKIINTASSIFGKDPNFDPKLIADFEGANKLTVQMGATLAKALTRGPEAAQTIQNIGSAVPGIENTGLGNKVVVASIQAQLQREIDKRDYQRQWLDSKGSLEGSAEGFNKDHPPQGYADRAMAQFGLEGTGDEKTTRFKSADDLQRAVQAKLLKPEEAAAIARSDPRLLKEINSRKK